MEYFCGNAGGRNISKKLMGCLPLTAEMIDRRGLDVNPHGPQTVTLGTRLIEKRHTYYAPTVTVCSTPFDLPSIDQIQLEIAKYHAPDDGGEEVETKSSDR